MTTPAPRRAAWSGEITASLPRHIPESARPAVLTAVKAIHTAIFFSMSAAVLLFLVDGIRGRPTRRTWIAGGLTLAESAIFVSNNQVCPLTPLAEELGAERGSVADIFLPDWASRRIPLVGGTAFLAGLALHARQLPTFLRRRVA